jgi:hypothetical protein
MSAAALPQGMKLPQKYPYNPSWGQLLLGIIFFGAACPVMVRMAHHPEEGMPVVVLGLGRDGAIALYWLLAVSVPLLVLMFVFLMVRRCFVYEFLELQADALILPRGPFRSGYQRLPYLAIQRVWEEGIFRKVLLYVVVDGRRVTIAPACFADRQTYAEVRDFLAGFVQRVPGRGDG